MSEIINEVDPQIMEVILSHLELSDLDGDTATIAELAGIEIAKALLLNCEGMRISVKRVNRIDSLIIKYLSKKYIKEKYTYKEIKRISKTIGRGFWATAKLMQKRERVLTDDDIDQPVIKLPVKLKNKKKKLWVLSKMRKSWTVKYDFKDEIIDGKEVIICTIRTDSKKELKRKHIFNLRETNYVGTKTFETIALKKDIKEHIQKGYIDQKANYKVIRKASKMIQENKSVIKDLKIYLSKM